MKRLGYLLLLMGALFGIILSPKAKAAITDNFEIQSFSADYYLSRDKSKYDSLQVVETIQAVFPDYDQNHGILRAIPKTYHNLSLHLKVTSVTDENDQPYKYSTSAKNDNEVLKIGDSDTYVRGLKTYKITYTMRNVISFYENDQLYWNVNGDQWPQHIGSVVSRVHIPSELAGNLEDKQRCLSGAYGHTLENCTIQRASEQSGTQVTVASGNLKPYETLTFVIGFNKGTFLPNKADLRMAKLRPYFIAAGFLLLPFISVLILYHKWRKYGRDPKGKGVIIPQYQPPKELNALTSDVILHENLRNNAFSALIVELAIKKYLKIYEIPKKGLFGKTDYELELVNDISALNEEEQATLKLFFSQSVAPGTKIKLSDLKNKLYSGIQELTKSVPASLFKRGYFKNNPNKIRARYLSWGAALMVLGFSILFLGFLGALAVIAAINLILIGLILIIAAPTMPGRSIMGVETRDYLLGLKEYMELAEADRIKFLQSPKGVKQYGDPTKPKNQIKLFEKLLPYAMLFGIEKDWAKQFKDLYTSPPDWYGGNFATFNAVYLASSLSSFSSVSSASFTAPSSSSSSGFGGGGFSGGGGGGGGGGGW